MSKHALGIAVELRSSLVSEIERLKAMPSTDSAGTPYRIILFGKQLAEIEQLIADLKRAA